MKLFVFILLGLSLPPLAKPKPIESQQTLGRAVCRLWIDYSSTKLSGELRLRLSIDGPAPIEVDMPKPLSATTDWQVSAFPPFAESLPDGGGHWHQTFRLKPFQTGRVPLKLQPIRYRTGNEVRDWEVTWPSIDIQVDSSIENLDLGSARPVTDIERIGDVERMSSAPWFVVLAAILIIAALGVAIVMYLRKRDKPQPILSPRERALAEFARFDPPAPEQLPHVADVLRQFLEHQYQLAALRQTTGEFHATLRAAKVLTEEQVESVAEILARCDLIKFAGVKPEREACEILLRRARALVAEAGPMGQGDSHGSSESPR